MRRVTRASRESWLAYVVRRTLKAIAGSPLVSSTNTEADVPDLARIQGLDCFRYPPLEGRPD